MNGSQLAPTAQININTASVEQLASLMGVGKAKAEAIVSIRKKKSFSLPSDLLKVPGFGPRLLELNKKYITIPTSTLTTTNNKRPATLASKESRRLKQPSFYTKKCKKSSRIKQTRAAAAKHTNGCFTTTPYSDRVASLTSYSKTPPVTPGTSRVDTNIAAATTTASAAASHAKDVPRTSDVGCAGRLRSTSNAEAKHCKEELAAAKVSIKSCSSDAAAACSHENHVPKRKPDSKHGKSGGVGPSPSKKSCKSAEPSNPASPNNTAQPLNSGNVVHTFGTIITSSSQSCTSVAAMRRKIPSKNNPPTDLPPWLKTFQDWSHAERMLALDEIIAMCEPTQVRHIMAVIEPQFQRDFISLLPKELALYVLSFLEPRDLLQAAQTCSYWRILSEDNLLWREKCKEESIEWVPPVPRPPSGVTKALRRGRYGSAASSSSSAGDGAVGDCGTNQTVTAPPWKELYMKQHQIEQNWRHAAINNTYRRKVLKGHDDHVITCLEFCGNRIVSGSDDNTLKVWSADTGKCLRTLVGHTGGVWSSQMRDNIIISGSTDRTLRVWDADTGECVHALYGHSSTVRCMHLHEEHVVSGSRDATLRVWEVATGRCVHVLMGHVAAVRCVQYDGKYIVSGAYDYSVKVWDAETETCLHTLQGHTNRVYSLQFDGSHIVSGSLDTSIRVWDVETGNCLHTLIGHQSLTSGMELKDNILVSGNADSTVKVWDITTGQCLTTLQGANKHQSAVTCLQFNKKFVITSSDDGTVKIWDLRRGEFVRNLVSLASGGSGGVVWRVRCSNTRLVCAVGSRNGTEETKLLVINFDCDDKVASSNKTNCTKDKITRSSAAAAQRMVENGVDNANHNNDADPSHSDSDLDY